MRLFAAVELSGEARDAIAAAQAAIAGDLRRAGESSLRFVRPEHMHLTLSFIGEVSDAAAGGIIEAMKRPLAAAPFRIVFGGVGVFPPKATPRVLWLGVGSGEEPLVQLQELVAARLGEAGIEPERRPFHPHLTLARWRDRSTGGRSALAALTTAQHARDVTSVDVSAVTLFHSRLSPSGPTYHALAHARLVGPDAPLH